MDEFRNSFLPPKELWRRILTIKKIMERSIEDNIVADIPLCLTLTLPLPSVFVSKIIFTTLQIIITASDIDPLVCRQYLRDLIEIEVGRLMRQN